MIFKDRKDAGKELANPLYNYLDKKDAIVLAFPRGGLPVAYEVSQALHLPIDLMFVRKLGVPGQEELALGAIAMSNTIVFNKEVMEHLNLTDSNMDMIIAEEHKELRRRNKEYRDNRPEPDVENKIVILVDDGMATGANMRAAVDAVKKHNPAKIVVAVPVASYPAMELLENSADEVFCLSIPEPFYGVGGWYSDFRQTSDEEVKEILSRVNSQKSSGKKYG